MLPQTRSQPFSSKSFSIFITVILPSDTINTELQMAPLNKSSMSESKSEIIDKNVASY
jgi:hypothetical protein